MKQDFASCGRLIIHVVAKATGTCKIKYCFSSLSWAVVHGGRICCKNINLGGTAEWKLLHCSLQIKSEGEKSTC